MFEDTFRREVCVPRVAETVTNARGYYETGDYDSLSPWLRISTSNG